MAEKAQDFDEITYVPSEGDPARVSWNGVEFKAHIPVKISKSHTILVPMPTQISQPDGTVHTRHVEKKVPMATIAKGNPSFMVNGVVAEKKDSKVRVPETSDEYRGYAMRWIAASSECGAMDARWKAEEALRARCGCSSDDELYLRPFFEAKWDDCQKAAKAA